MKLKTIALAIAGALLCAAPAQAQQGASLVRMLLDSASVLMANEDYEETDEAVTGSLEQGQDEEFEMELEAGQSYIFVGVCDENCSDIDITIYDEDGDEIDSDVEMDDTPMVMIEAEEDMTVTIKVTMATCDDECHFGLSVFQGQ